jgi:DNA mismatch endonuclease (patch repair protein)
LTLTRSQIMARIRRRDTRPELALRRAIWHRGLRFRVDHPVAGIHVDVAFVREQVAVFVDGCFWHGCPRHGRRPKSNRGYWGPKLRRNRARDAAQSRALRRMGWTVLRIWEHRCIATPLAAAGRVATALAARRSAIGATGTPPTA